MTSDLDRQIASVLGLGADLQSSELAELLSEAETEAFLANETAENERKAMVDPTVLSVIEHKRKAEEAELTHARLQAAIPKLQHRLAQAKAAEYAIG